jgi:hypothetical protein
MERYRIVVGASAWPADRWAMGTGTPRSISRVIAV